MIWWAILLINNYVKLFVINPYSNNLLVLYFSISIQAITYLYQDDDYVCTAYKLDSEKEMYITQFKVEGTAERAHHMLLFGCGEIPPEAANPYW